MFVLRACVRKHFKLLPILGSRERKERMKKGGGNREEERGQKKEGRWPYTLSLPLGLLNISLSLSLPSCVFHSPSVHMFQSNRVLHMIVEQGLEPGDPGRICRKSACAENSEGKRGTPDWNGPLRPTLFPFPHRPVPKASENFFSNS